LLDSKEADTLGNHTTTRAPKWPLSIQASQRSFDQYYKDLKIGISSVSLDLTVQLVAASDQRSPEPRETAASEVD